VKAILEFDLPEDEHHHRAALNGSAAVGALYELDSMLRNAAKYGEHDERTLELLSTLRGMIPRELIG
jgi:hypothetical protein